jgi:hypothetical protein
MTRTPMLTLAEIRRVHLPAMRATVRSTAELHSRYEPGSSEARTEYGACNPCFN